LGPLLALADSIELETSALESVSAEKAISASQWAQENLREFELLLEDEEMSVSREEGEIISDVSRARRLLKDQSKRRESIANSQKRTLLQLRGLAAAIGNGTTHSNTTLCLRAIMNTYGKGIIINPRDWSS
jgi:hypothetical protein